MLASGTRVGIAPVNRVAATSKCVGATVMVDAAWRRLRVLVSVPFWGWMAIVV